MICLIPGYDVCDKMEITKDVINKFYAEIEAMNITPEQGSPLTSASSLRLKLLVWLKFENEDDYEIGKKRARKFIDELKLKYEIETI